MKKLLLMSIVSAFILTSCGGSDNVIKTNDKFEFGMGPAPSDNVNVNTSSGTDVSVYSSGVSVSVGSGNVDVQTDETLKDIDKIIDDISSEDDK